MLHSIKSHHGDCNKVNCCGEAIFVAASGTNFYSVGKWRSKFIGKDGSETQI